MWKAGVLHWLAPTVDPYREQRALASLKVLNRALFGHRRAERDVEGARGDPRAVHALETLESAREAARTPAAEQLREVLGDGLGLRRGRFLRGFDYEVFNALWRLLIHLGGTMPRGVAVCWACGEVFEPRRKGQASKCARCHDRPPPAPPLAPEIEDSRRITYAMPVGGRWEVRRFHICAVCGAPFEPARSDAETCSSACRVRRHRSSELVLPASS